MFEEMTNEELMEFEGGSWLAWAAAGIAAAAIIGVVAVSIVCPPAGAAAAAGGSELSAEFLAFMGAAAAL